MIHNTPPGDQPVPERHVLPHGTIRGPSPSRSPTAPRPSAALRPPLPLTPTDLRAEPGTAAELHVPGGACGGQGPAGSVAGPADGEGRGPALAGCLQGQ